MIRWDAGGHSRIVDLHGKEGVGVHCGVMCGLSGKRRRGEGMWNSRRVPTYDEAAQMNVFGSIVACRTRRISS